MSRNRTRAGAPVRLTLEGCAAGRAEPGASVRRDTGNSASDWPTRCPRRRGKAEPQAEVTSGREGPAGGEGVRVCECARVHVRACPRACADPPGPASAPSSGPTAAWMQRRRRLDRMATLNRSQPAEAAAGQGGGSAVAVSAAPVTDPSGRPRRSPRTRPREPRLRPPPPAGALWCFGRAGATCARPPAPTAASSSAWPPSFRPPPPPPRPPGQQPASSPPPPAPPCPPSAWRAVPSADGACSDSGGRAPGLRPAGRRRTGRPRPPCASCGGRR